MLHDFLACPVPKSQDCYHLALVKIAKMVLSQEMLKGASGNRVMTSDSLIQAILYFSSSHWVVQVSFMVHTQQNLSLVKLTC